MDYKLFSIFENSFEEITSGIKLAQCMKADVNKSKTENDVYDIQKSMDELCVSEKLFCSFCNESFEDKDQQRLHYKLDWHRYNLKQNLMARPIVSEEEFQQKADDVSSISGSESDSEDDEEEEEEEEEDNSCDSLHSKKTSNEISKEKDKNAIRKLQVQKHAKVFFENHDGKILSVYRCILHEKKNVPEKESDLVTSLLLCKQQPMWAIIMLGGGHFAAGVFSGNDPVVHKTFHSYTVRARQGGAQSSRDKKSGGSHPKSAGASLRRYNEASFNQHIQEILTEWSQYLETCSLIVCRAVGNNRGLLFGGRNPLLNKKDPRVRTIPFPTRRATYKEVQRVHKMLSMIEIYGCADKFQTVFPQSPKKPSPERKSKMNEGNYVEEQHESALSSTQTCKKIDRAKSRPTPNRLIPDIEKLGREKSSSEGSEEGEISYTCLDADVSLKDDLQEYEDTVPQSVKNKVRKKYKKNNERKNTNPSKSQPKDKVSEAVKILQKKLVAACKLSNTVLLKECLENCVKTVDSEENSEQENKNKVTEEELLNCLNEHVSDNGSTLLHIAAENGNTSMIRSLLEAGCDPSVKNKKAQPPFAVSADRETKSIFRRFMGEYPERYDYRKAQIPGPLTDEMEQRIVERRKEVKKAKRDREKERKKEETEMDRFLKLSDREKRALAAERRILANNAQGKSDIRVVSRCFECAADITGKVPFEYDIHRFCTMDCLKKHRQKLKMQSQLK